LCNLNEASQGKARCAIFERLERHQQTLASAREVVTCSTRAVEARRVLERFGRSRMSRGHGVLPSSLAGLADAS
jgi:hypothetical protein